MSTPSLFDVHPMFDGPDLDPADHIRLTDQHARVFQVMADGQWRTLAQIQRECSGPRVPEASISARLRDFRKVKFGSHTVERTRVSGGLWSYRVLVR